MTQRDTMGPDRIPAVRLDAAGFVYALVVDGMTPSDLAGYRGEVTVWRDGVLSSHVVSEPEYQVVWLHYILPGLLVLKFREPQGERRIAVEIAR